jgi:hypothetical protein
MSKETESVLQERRTYPDYYKEMAFGAQAIGMRTVWTGNPSGSNPTPNRSISGEVILSTPVPISIGSNGLAASYVTLARLKILQAIFSEKKDADSRPEDISDGVRPGAVLVVAIDDFDDLQTTLILSLSQTRFNEIWNGVERGIGIEVFGQLLIEEGLASRSNDEHLHIGLVTRIEDVGITVRSSLKSEEWHTNRVRYKLCHDYLSDDTGQVAQIANEFAQAIVETSRKQGQWNNAFEHARSIVVDVREIFRERINLTSQEFHNSWTLPAKDFETLANQKSDEESKTLKERYSRIWTHYSVAEVLNQGESVSGPLANGHQIHIEKLERLADRLLERPDVVSPTLEWALIDALIYGNCVGFARKFYKSEHRLGSISIPKPLVGIDEAKVARVAAWSVLKGFAIEGLKIAATHIIANILANGDLEASWIITTGITCARWIRRAILREDLDPQKKQHEVLTKMIDVHNHLSTYRFNALQLRQELVVANNLNASFSYAVFNILDARIHRETEKW